MKALNLVNLDRSDIKYEISKFPDGQQQVTIKDVDKTRHNPKDGTGSFFLEKYPVTILARLNNFMDLELIICTVASLREAGVKDIHLSVPYFLGSRSDRKFEQGSNNYLKTVICPIINGLNLMTVTVLDPHSNVLEMGLNNFRKIDNLELVQEAFNDLKLEEGTYILASPDAGAKAKVEKIADKIGYKGDILVCGKTRSIDGSLSKTVVPIYYNMRGKDIIVIDDICDGGATFTNIATEVERFYKEDIDWDEAGTGCKVPKIYLIVTHGIFSKGLRDLALKYENIYCTNSYKDLPVETGEFVKQYDVFN